MSAALSAPPSGAVSDVSLLPTDAPEKELLTEKSQGPSYSQKLSALMKREQRLRSERESLTKDRQEIEGLKDELARARAAREKAKLNPKAYLEEAGLTFEEIQEFFLNGEQPSSSTLESELEKRMEERFKSLEEKELELQKKQVEQQAAQYKSGLKSFIESSDCEFLKATDAPEELVYDLMLSYFEHSKAAGDPKVLSPEEAVKLIEDSLEQEFENRFLKLGKVQAKLTKKPEEMPFSRPSQTLSNSTPMGSLATEPPRRLSEAERLAAAAAQLRWVP